MVPGHGPRAPGDVQPGDQRARCPARPASPARRTSRSTANMSDTPRRKESCRHSFPRRLCREGRDSNFSTRPAKSDKPFFINVNFMKVHQPNLPAPEFEHKSMSKTKYADSIVELDTRIGRIMDKLRALGLDKNTSCSTRPTTAPGRTSIPTPAIRRSAAPRAPCAKAATAFRRLRCGQARSSRRCEEPRHRRRPRPHGDLRGARRRKAAGEGPRGQADHLRQLRHVASSARHGQTGPQDLVLLHRERAYARSGARCDNYKARFQPARRRRRSTPAAAVDSESRLERRPKNTSRPYRRCSTCGRTRRSVTTSS